MSRKNDAKTRLQVNALEGRDMPSVSQLWASGSLWVVKTDDVATTVTVSQSGTNIVLTEGGTGRTWSRAASLVSKVEFQGGAGSDRFVDNVYALPVNGYGNGGDDYLEGYNGADMFDGGAGNDILVGYGGNDAMWGGDGNDLLRGMDGDDQLQGNNGNDQLNGGAGTDSMWGQDGNDVLIAIDSGTADYTEGGNGADVIWVDKISTTTDRVYGGDSTDKTQAVASFANGADRTLNGDRIADPTLKSGAVYKTFSNNPLFASNGPSLNDIKQGSIGDCWMLAELGAVANDNPQAIRQRVVDFNDGTYGVALGGNFYRVDNDLPAYSSTSTDAAYAHLGLQNSMWVAVMEKAYAHYRTGANSYASIENGWSVEAARALGATTTGDNAISGYGSATALANAIYTQWNSYNEVTVGFVDSRYGKYLPGGLINNHMYTVASVARNSSGVVTSITLRNPWGIDTDNGSGNDGNNDGYVTVTPAQLYALQGRVNYGRV